MAILRGPEGLSCMRIGIDIDEVMVDFLSAFLDDYNIKHGTDYRRDTFHSFGMHHVMQEDMATITERVKIFEQSDSFRNLVPVTGAVEGVNELAKNNDLIIVSSRSEAIHDYTRDWLNQHFPKKIAEVHFSSHPYVNRQSTNSKADLCLMLRLDVLIEDALEYVLPCAQQGIKVLLFDTPWNRQPDLPANITRVHSWQDIVDVISGNEI